MVATDGNRDSATLQYVTRNKQRDTFCEACFVEHGENNSGEDRLRAPTPRAAQPSKQNGNVRQSGTAPSNCQSTTWLAGGPIPSEAHATSFAPSPPDVNCPTSPNLEEKKILMSKSIEHSMNGRDGARSDSKQTLPRRSSSIMSLETTSATYRDPDDAILYQRPQSPFISSSLYVKHAEKPPGISDAELRRLLKLRRRVQTIRLQIHAQRSQVDAKRDAQSDADEQYIKRIRTNHVTKEQPGQTDASELLILENLWRQCQAARDAYGPAVDSLLSLEYRLEMEEAKLERIEERLYEQLDMTLPESRIISPLPLAKQDDDGSQDEDDESTSPSSQESRHTDDVGYDDYLRRLGNLDLLQERYQSLMNEKAMLEEERAKRFRVGRDLDSENMEFLARFEYIIKPVSVEIVEVSEDVKRLKQLCLEKGLIDANGNPTQDSTISEESPAELGEEARSERPAEQSKPSQYQEPSGNNELGPSISVYHGGFGPFINLWLLHKLRSSPVEVLLFSCYVAACVDNMEELKWQAEALRLWDHDGAGKNTRENVEHLESYIVSSIHRTFDKDSTFERKQYPGARKVDSSKSTMNRTTLPILFRSRPRAKSAV
jgi:hypothetical protein